MKIYCMPVKFKTPFGDLTLKEIQEKKLPYGAYVSDELPIIGQVECLSTPPLASGVKELFYALSNLKNFNNLKAEYAKLIATSEVIKWHLINVMIVGKQVFVKIMPEFASVPDWTLSKKNFSYYKDIYKFLKNNGAHYTHVLTTLSQPNPTILQNLIELLGDEIVNERTTISSVLNTYFQAGSVDFKNAEVLIKRGANVNTQGSKFHNTILHHLIANECPPYVLKFIDLIENISLPKDRRMNYTLQDIEGKTPLLFAIQMREEEVVSRLLVLHKAGRDVGIDVPDKLNRTPLLIAAALGCIVSVNELLACGANPYHVDKEGHGLDWYMRASDEEISKILRSVFVEPERSVFSDHNWIYWNDQNGSPLILEENGEKNFVLISSKQPYLEKIKKVLAILEQSNDSDLENFILSQLSCMNKKSSTTVLDKCRENQKITQKIIINYFEKELRERCALGDDKSVQKILDHKFIEDINSKDSLDRTPLHYAVMRQMLVEETANNKSPEFISTCMKGHVNVVSLLLKFGADLNSQNKNGNTPLALVKRDTTSSNSLDREVALAIDQIFDEQVKMHSLNLKG